MAQRDTDLYLLTGDLGFRLFDEFRERFSDRFLDMGIAEQNMIGVAAGLALSGKKVYCYSIIPFLVMRAYEQIRVDIAYHNLDVKLVGVGGGFTYGMEGFTHFGLEDFALMRSLPNMTVVVPADPVEARCVAELSATVAGPMYIRLGRTGDPVLHDATPPLEIGKAMILREGVDASIFVTGSMAAVALSVADRLEHTGIAATVINMHTLKPLDVETIKSTASTRKIIISIEEHNISGGLGSAIGEVLLESHYHGLFKRFGISEPLGTAMGDADFLRDTHGLTADNIFQQIFDMARKEKGKSYGN
jgi:transketolase